MKGQEEIKHWFDVWHIAVGIFKKLQGLGKKKTTADVGPWAKSIARHTYYCAVSSKGNKAEVLAKWTSITNHVVGIHSRENTLYPKCQHDNNITRAWLKKGSKSYKELESVILNRCLLADIGQMSPHTQTSGLEAHHKVVCHFASKFYHYFYRSMEARLGLAVLHTNENALRNQAVKQTGEPMFKVKYPKSRGGEAVATVVREPITYNYLEILMIEVLELSKQYPTMHKAQAALLRDIPSPITSNASKVDKAVAVAAHRTRFANHT